jgi:hypothetical protein
MKAGGRAHHVGRYVERERGSEPAGQGAPRIAHQQHGHQER